jgi:hypothetical protein
MVRLKPDPTDPREMGLSAPSEVPDFFILRNLAPAGKDAHGRPIFKARPDQGHRRGRHCRRRSAATGRRPRAKAFQHGMVVIVEHGKAPSAAIIERANGIREEWIKYFAATTGQRASMTATPR